jgi:predicted O-methyltransferase YrrM
MLDTLYGNVNQDTADRLGDATRPVDGVPHEPGSTEPWISQLVADFVVARGARTVLETGCFKGATSVYILDALQRLGGGDLHLCEIDQARMDATAQRTIPLTSKRELGVSTWCQHGDVLRYLAETTDRFDVAWVDDCHEKPHVTKELMLLMPKMNKGGLILLHDVYGVCDLKTVVQQFGGYSLDLPRLGPAGGLGIIQCP